MANRGGGCFPKISYPSILLGRCRLPRGLLMHFSIPILSLYARSTDDLFHTLRLFLDDIKFSLGFRSFLFPFSSRRSVLCAGRGAAERLADVRGRAVILHCPGRGTVQNDPPLPDS